MLSLKAHNIIDYVAAVVLVLCPYIFGFGDIASARNVFLFAGFILALYSVFTNYYFSLLKLIPLGAHMTFDVLLGIFLMVAPWLFAYRGTMSPGQEYLHYILGVAVFALVGVTREKTEEDKREHGIRIEPVPTART